MRDIFKCLLSLSFSLSLCLLHLQISLDECPEFSLSFSLPLRTFHSLWLLGARAHAKRDIVVLLAIYNNEANLLTICIRYVAARIHVCAIEVIVTHMSMIVGLVAEAAVCCCYCCCWTNATVIIIGTIAIKSMAQSLIFNVIEEIRKILHDSRAR